MEEDEEKSGYSSYYNGVAGMSRVDELTHALTQAIIESDEYREYKELEADIMKRPDLKRAVDDFRRENFRLQYSDDVEDVISSTEELNNRYIDVRQQPTVERFLSAEMALCRMVQEVCMTVVGAIDFNMDFLQ